MNYFKLGDKLNNKDYNSLVYLMRKFKRLNTNLKLGKNVISSDYGDFILTGGLINYTGNYVIENNTRILSNNCLLNCFYTFNFTVIKEDTTGEVNKRILSVTGGTGDNGQLNILLTHNMLEDDETILSDFSISIVFDIHEYITSLDSLNVKCEYKKYNNFFDGDNTLNIKVKLTDSEDDTPIPDYLINMLINGGLKTITTNEEGIGNTQYSLNGTQGKSTIKIGGQQFYFFDGGITCDYYGKSIKLHQDWRGLVTNGDITIFWGDGSSETYNSKNAHGLSYNYTDGETLHHIVLCGDVLKIGYLFFHDVTKLERIVVSNTVKQLDRFSFADCHDLIMVIIPENVLDIGDYCFNNCNSLTKYELYWKNENIIAFTNKRFWVNNNTLFVIPTGQTSNYVNKGYPEDKVIERG